MNKVTYVIPLWRETRLIDVQASLESLLHESYLINDIILVHDGYDSFGLLDKLDSVLLSKILFVYTYNNKGPGVARNHGAKFSRSDFIFFLDAGDTNFPHRTQLQLSSLASGYDASYGEIREVLNDQSFRVRSFIKNQKFLLILCHFRAPYNNVTLAIRKSTFFKIGGFYDSRFAEDWVLMARLISFKARICPIPSLLVNVDARGSFVFRRTGLRVFRQVQRALLEMSRLDAFNSLLLLLSSVVQFCTRVLLPSRFVSLIYSLLRKS